MVTVTDYSENETSDVEAPLSESRSARKEAQGLTEVLHNQLGAVAQAVAGRHFGADEQGKIESLRGAVEAAKAVQDTATLLVAALERALVAKSA